MTLDSKTPFFNGSKLPSKPNGEWRVRYIARRHGVSLPLSSIILDHLRINDWEGK